MVTIEVVKWLGYTHKNDVQTNHSMGWWHSPTYMYQKRYYCESSLALWARHIKGEIWFQACGTD